MSAFPAIAELVPHTPPMILLDEMVSWEDHHAVCTLTLRPDAPFVTAGRVSTVVAIEYMAQGVAACLGYAAFLGGDGVRVGMLVGCRRMDVLEPYVEVGTRLSVDVRRVRGDETLSRFECAVTRVADGVAVASASLTLFHADEPPSDEAD